MLQLNNVTKVYNTKGGESVFALQEVSVTFGETGLVFLLGKSGSGKSTLLNIAGGLDEPTHGEVVVMGKSSKEFTGSDFDSYRNTYVGFVFQEYNVLNEFNVEDNVALALELQGKTKNHDEIKRILDEVELGDFAKRKPNTLSGGQKQRIAIARALVKNPQIIMADEPTGALDSATGKQVFDTLKKLSETRLVLVVSHDREFAELYGDRIIELKDGRIISDVSKQYTEADTVSQSITKIDENTLTVSCGSALTQEEIEEINRFIASGEGSVLISKGKTEIDNFRKVNHIEESGERAHFSETPPITASEPKEQAQFIRSRLPMRKAFKIGASNLKIKRIRLAFTIILAAVSFIMFGLASTMMLFDEEYVLKRSFVSSVYQQLILDKNYETRYYSSNYDDYWASSEQTLFTPAEVAAFGEEAFGAFSFDSSPTNVDTLYSIYYSTRVYRIAALPENHSLREHLLAGKYPSSANEVCVSSYFLESIKNCQLYDINENGPTGELISIKSAEDLVGKKLSFSPRFATYTFTVSGVFDSGKIPSEYDPLKTQLYDLGDSKVNLLKSYLQSSYHMLMLVSEEFEQIYAPTVIDSILNIRYFEYYQEYVSASIGDRVFFGTAEFAAYNTANRRYDVTFFTEGKNTVDDGEIVVNFKQLLSYYQSLLEMPETDEALRDELKELIPAIEIILNGTLTEESQDAMQSVVEFCRAHELTVSLTHEGLNGFDEWGTINDGTARIVGFYQNNNYFQDGVYCSPSFLDRLTLFRYEDETKTKYVPEADAMYSNVFVPFSRTEASYNEIHSKMAHNEETDVFYTFDNRIANEVNMISSVIENLSVMFVWIGAVLAVFSSLLLFNFISVSIANKQREIGILRAVGARGIDVFKIFFSESGVIVGICLLLALFGTLLTTLILNGVLHARLGLSAQLFVFGPIPILLMIGISAVVALIATFLPVYLAAKKKPVESIRSL